MAQQTETEITIETQGRGLFEFTAEVTAWVSEHARGTGLLTLFLRHTSASLLIQENADADVLRDLETFFAALVPDDPARYRHVTEGPDDMPAHIRAALTQTQLSIPVSGGALVLGTWQGIYLYEHRTAGHVRKVALHLLTG
ncbi:MAG: secondary thiamine-phosphate synthase enzyme YjbQ [Alphaproteobacteria bacterium]|nr:secondary thiamine-phosphate synthase enzyme YjbQ [Alphaproteobacteria bacterium]